MVSWVFFRSDSIGSALRFLEAMAGGGSKAELIGPLRALIFQPSPLATALLGIAVLFWPSQAYDFCERLTPARMAILLAIFALALLPVYGLSSNPFLYFQF
jgi:alginate O-acetyltransferase complex protein AlgI